MMRRQGVGLSQQECVKVDMGVSQSIFELKYRRVNEGYLY